MRFVSGPGWHIEHMFEDLADAELIDVMGEATRDESTAIAQRLLAVGELYARRAPEWRERILVAHRSDRGGGRGDFGGAKHQPRPRGGAVALGRTLWERLPQVAKVFAARGD